MSAMRKENYSDTYSQSPYKDACREKFGLRRSEARSNNYRKDWKKKCKLNLEGAVSVANAHGLNAERVAAIGPDGK